MTVRVTAAMCAGGRSLSDPRLSPDGSTVVMVATSTAGATLVAVDAGGGPEQVLSTEPRPARGWGVLDWMPAGDAVVYVAGDGTLWLQPLVGGPSRPLAATTAARGPAVSPDGTTVAYVVDGRHAAVAGTGEDGAWPQRLSAAPDFVADPAWSPDGATVAWHEWDVPAMAWDDSHLATAPASAGMASRLPTPHPAAVAQPRFAPDGRLGFLCDAGGWLNLWVAGPDGGAARPLVEEPFEHAGPTWGSGMRTWTWCAGGSQIAFTRNVEGFGELCLLDVATGEVTVVDRGVFSGLSWAAGRLAALRSGARTPDRVVVYPELAVADPASATPTTGGSAAVDRRRPARITVAHGPVAGFESAGLPEPEVVHWDGPDIAGLGPTVHGRLTQAPRSADAPAPVLVWVHGGPTGQHQVTFNARAAFLVDRGWNLLQVDPRGSTGWGRRYAQALRGAWGRLDVDDVVAAIRAVGPRGWGDPDRVALMGASSAGLVVLSVLARHPGLCAAGIDLYGVVDLFELQETTHRFEAHYNPSLLGPLPDAAAVWRDRSPLTHVGAITDPLLVLYGSADPVVVPSQSQRLVEALAARGAPVEHHCYDGEGHGWSRPETVADELTRIDAFLTRTVLRGRRQ